MASGYVKMEPVTETDIITEWTDAITDPHLLERCVRICRANNLSAADLANEWELMQMNGINMRMTLDTLGDLENRVKQSAGMRRKAGAKPQFSTRPAATACR